MICIVRYSYITSEIVQSENLCYYYNASLICVCVCVRARADAAHRGQIIVFHGADKPAGNYITQ